MYLMPEFPATDVINAAAIGIVSGLAATGAHQVIKQANKKQEEVIHYLPSQAGKTDKVAPVQHKLKRIIYQEEFIL